MCQQFNLLSNRVPGVRRVGRHPPGLADCFPGSDGRPSAVRQPRQLSPRTHAWPREVKKLHRDFFPNIIITINYFYLYYYNY